MVNIYRYVEFCILPSDDILISKDFHPQSLTVNQLEAKDKKKFKWYGIDINFIKFWLIFASCYYLTYVKTDLMSCGVFLWFLFI